MTQDDKAAAVAHYEGQAAIAELARWQGKGLQPKNGCGLHQAILGDASVWLEYDYSPASGDGFNEPREPEILEITGILINGALCDVMDVAPHKVEDWGVEILEARAADAEAAQCQHDDALDGEAADRAADRYERDLDRMASQ